MRYDTSLGPTDVAMRRESLTEPAQHLTQAYIDKDGKIQVARAFEFKTPGDMAWRAQHTPPDIAWEYMYTIDEVAVDVAIEYDGSFMKTPPNNDDGLRIGFVTEGEAWVFWVTPAGLLKGRKGEEGDTLVFASGVLKVNAIRGWKNFRPEIDEDQGLIIAFLKTDGLVYFRRYTHKPLVIWHIEELLSSVGNVKDFLVYRTNDYRVGYVIYTHSGDNYHSYSGRSWTGMAIDDHYFTVAVTGVTANMIPINYLNGYLPDHYVSVGVGERMYIGLCPLDDVPAPTATDIDAINGDLSTTLTFTAPLVGDCTGLQAGFVARDGGNVLRPVTSTAKGATDYELVLYWTSLVALWPNLTIQWRPQLDGIFRGDIVAERNAHCKQVLGQFDTVAIVIVPTGYNKEYITVLPTPSVVMTPIDYRTGYAGQEHVTVAVTSVTVVMTFIGVIDP